ncbi:MAG TPA: TonB-dependent siderophore receptor [Steroidobacteraceae bacterium]|nr:TonB-dependent siderophore receptor [Steroidobacteraceae bacterium]
MSIGNHTTGSLRFAIGCALALATTVGSAQQAGSDQELEEIIVTGSQIRLPDPFAGGQVAQGGRAGILGNLETLETPFSSTNYTEELMRNQQAKSVADVLLNDPNVRVARGFGNFQELFIIRGFPAYSDDMTYNGIYGILPRQFVASEFMERVELFRGASAFLNGAAPGGSNLGGTVNLVPKRAPDEGLTRLTAGWETASAYYLAGDFGRRFGPDKATGIRGNIAWRDGETAVEDQDRELTVLSFGIDHEGEKLRLAADLGYQDHHIDAPRPSVTPFGGIPEAPDADSNFAQPWTYTDEEQLFGVVRAEYDITRAVSVWGAYGMRQGEEANVLANPNALADGSMTAYRFDNTREDDVTSGEIGLRWDFATGPIEHRIVLSASTFKIDSKNAYAFSDFFSPFVTDLYDPVDVAPPAATFFTGGNLNNPRTTFETETSSYAIADMMTFADGKFMLTLGARDQTLKNDNFDYNTGAKLSGFDESEVTPVGGIVYRPTDSLSVFANYIEGLVAGDTAPFTGPAPGFLPVSNAGEIQDPIAAEQIELGVKFESDSFGGSLSIFNVEKAVGALADNPDTPAADLEYSLSGEVRHRGVEAGVYGQPVENVRVIGGVTWLDAEYTEGGVGLEEGNQPIGTPEVQANVNVEWDLPAVEGLTFEARALYTSSQFADTGNTLELDSWTRFDLGARYATELAGRPFSVRARVDNVTDENDWISAGGFPGFGYLVLGAPRTFVVSASIDF